MKKGIIRTQHTVLVEVTSHKSGGRATIEIGHLAVTDSTVFSDVALRNPIFKSFEIGAYLVVTMQLSGSRRIVKTVEEVSGVHSRKEFLSKFDRKLKVEEADYNKKHKIFGSPIPEAATPKPVEEPKEEPKPAPKADSPFSLFSSGKEIFISKEQDELFEAVHKISQLHHVSVMMIGASGYGKTSVPEQKAKDWGMEFLRWNCATVRDPEEFFGYRGAVDASTMTDEGEVFFSESEFTQKVEAGNVVIALDEINRVDPYILNILFSILDHEGKATVAGHEITVGDNVIFVATVNLGYQFTGTFQLDTALVNRFLAKVEVGALPQVVEEELLQYRVGVTEKQAKTIVSFMSKMRDLNQRGKLNLDASTRVSLQISELVYSGLGFDLAVKHTMIVGCEPEEKKEINDVLRMGF
jgi:MoxR-like ATPase